MHYHDIELLYAAIADISESAACEGHAAGRSLRNKLGKQHLCPHVRVTLQQWGAGGGSCSL